MTPRLAAALIEHDDVISRATSVATAVTDLPIDLDRPDGDPARLQQLAAAWGVERQVEELSAALARQTADE